MSRLSLSLLGPFQATLDGEPIPGFTSNKVRALLAYLAAEGDRPHHRQVLADLLWPDRAGLSNLRSALADLRRAIRDQQATPSFLLVSRDTIQFNKASDFDLDLAAFREHLASARSGRPAMPHLQAALALYRGSFLEGLALGESAAFEEWVLLRREEIGQQVLSILHTLAMAYAERGEYEQAIDCARRQIALEPWLEEAHRHLMRLLALSGQRSAALAQYDACRRLLAEGLGVGPARETTQLYKSILDGTFRPMVAVPALASHGVGVSLAASGGDARQSPVFVARERELAQLQRHLGAALGGQGRVVLVTGEPGSGKTALIAAFAGRAMEACGNLIVAGGNCNAHTGIGDPYLPFREILQTLTGDVEARRAGGAISRAHARRLWALLPMAVEALVDAGPDLLDVFVPGPVLALRAEAFAPGGASWRSRLSDLLQKRAASPGAGGLPQVDLFEQVTRVLIAIARQQPLLLILDDLQWADSGSIALLFHLGRRLTGSRILIVGAYREAEVAAVRDGERHPLASAVHELQRELGDIRVELAQAEGRRFVEAYLDSEPNRLSSAFRDTLYRHTGGNPLFTVELLRGLQERGDLKRDSAGRWAEGPRLDWGQLPARVEAVIAERIERLPAVQQQSLAVGSVEGTTFTAEVVARVLGMPEADLIACLSDPLGDRQGLVRAVRLDRLGAQRLSRYGFRHELFQSFLYGTLDPVRRAHLHEAIGSLLETLYGAQAAEVAVQLAWHFERAGLTARAVGYLLQAGRRAAQLSANEEAIALLSRGLALLATLPESPERAEQELNLQLSLGAPLLAAQGWGAPERARACERAYNLCRQAGTAAQLLEALFLLADMCRAQGEHDKSLELGQQLLDLAQRADDPRQKALAHWTLGETYHFLGDLALARHHLERAISLYDPRELGSLTSLTGPDMRTACLVWASWVLWGLGYPDQALARSQQAVALARELGHPLSLAFALAIGASCIHLLRREPEAAAECVEELAALTAESDVATMQPWTTILHGYGQVCLGRAEAGIAEMRQGLAAWQAAGAVTGRAYQILLLAEACGHAAQPAQGLEALAEGMALAERTGEHTSQIEMLRLRGELLLARSGGWRTASIPSASAVAPQAGDLQAVATEAEACFRRAIDMARRQQARSWELRAATSLCRLWQAQGREREAHELLAAVYGEFTEGLDTPDLQDARALVEGPALA